MPALKSIHSGAVRLDEIFLDTTYCDKKHAFPEQEASISAVLDLVEEEVSASLTGSEETRQILAPLVFKRPNPLWLVAWCCSSQWDAGSTLFVFGAYSIGKERVYTSVGSARGRRVHVEARRLAMLKCYNSPSDITKVRACDCVGKHRLTNKRTLTRRFTRHRCSRRTRQRQTSGSGLWATSWPAD